MVSHHIDTLSGTYPEIGANKAHILDMVALEQERFIQTLERGRRTVQRAIGSGGIDQDKLLELYDSQGLPPSVVSDFASDLGHSIEVPDRSEEHTSELQSRTNLVCRLLLEKKKSSALQKNKTKTT